MNIADVFHRGILTLMPWSRAARRMATAMDHACASTGVTGDALRIVWDAIALHTTPGIPEHKEPQVSG
jgi:hypothetical protein